MGYTWHDLAGNLGVAMIVVTYALVQLRRMRATTLHYSLLNALGAALILFSLAFEFNLSALLMEGFWLLISLVGVNLARRERAAQS